MTPLLNNSGIKILLPAIILILNVILRFTGLLSRDISLDEPFSIYHAQFKTGDVIELLKSYNNPPLYEILLHYWINLFGIEPVSVRSLPAIFSIAASLALYFLGKKHFSIFAGFIAALLLTFSNLSQAYAHDCRVYSLFLLLSIISMDAFFRMLRDNSYKIFFLFVLISTLNIYAHYFAIILLAIQGLCVLIFKRDRFKTFIFSCGAIAILYLPHIFVLISRFTHSTQNGTWVKAPEGIESIYNMLWAFSNQPVTTVISILVFVIFLFRLKHAKYQSKIILLWLVIPVIGIFILSFRVPMYLDRYLIFSLPAWYLILACVVEMISQNQKIQIGFAAILTGIYAVSFQSDPWTKRDVAQAVSYVRKHKSQHTVVIVNPSDFIETFSYHYNRDYFNSILNGQEYTLLHNLLKKEQVLFLNNSEDIPKHSLNAEKIIYFDYSNRTETNNFIAMLSENREAIKDTIFENGFRVIIFE